MVFSIQKYKFMVLGFHHYARSLNKISNNTQRNCDAVELVTAATQENSAGTESLAEIVDKIAGLTERLNNVVQG